MLFTIYDCGWYTIGALVGVERTRPEWQRVYVVCVIEAFGKAVAALATPSTLVSRFDLLLLFIFSWRLWTLIHINHFITCWSRPTACSSTEVHTSSYNLQHGVTSYISFCLFSLFLHCHVFMLRVRVFMCVLSWLLSVTDWHLVYDENKMDKHSRGWTTDRVRMCVFVRVWPFIFFLSSVFIFASLCLSVYCGLCLCFLFIEQYVHVRVCGVCVFSLYSSVHLCCACPSVWVSYITRKQPAVRSLWPSSPSVSHWS